MKKNENISIWKRIINFLKKIFGKSDVLLIDSPQKEYTSRDSTIEELSKQSKILALQKDYENGIIKEEQLSSDEKSSLKELYKKQVETLEIDIAIKKRELQSYKKKILNATQKLSLNNKM